VTGYDGSDSGESRSLTTEYSEELELRRTQAGRLMKAGSVPPIVYNCEKFAK